MVVSRLLALLLCHRVAQDDDGRPVLEGLYDRVVLPTVPGTDACVVYTKCALPPGSHDLTLSIVNLDSGREIGRAVHPVTIAPERTVHETTWSIEVRFDRLGAYMYRFLAGDELLGFTTVEVVSYRAAGDRP